MINNTVLEDIISQNVIKLQYQNKEESTKKQNVKFEKTIGMNILLQNKYSKEWCFLFSLAYTSTNEVIRSALRKIKYQNIEYSNHFKSKTLCEQIVRLRLPPDLIDFVKKESLNHNKSYAEIIRFAVHELYQELFKYYLNNQKIKELHKRKSIKEFIK